MPCRSSPIDDMLPGMIQRLENCYRIYANPSFTHVYLFVARFPLVYLLLIELTRNGVNAGPYLECSCHGCKYATAWRAKPNSSTGISTCNHCFSSSAHRTRRSLPKNVHLLVEQSRAFYMAWPSSGWIHVNRLVERVPFSKWDALYFLGLAGKSFSGKCEILEC